MFPSHLFFFLPPPFTKAPKGTEYERDWIDQLGESIPSLSGKISEIKTLSKQIPPLMETLKVIIIGNAC